MYILQGDDKVAQQQGVSEVIPFCKELTDHDREALVIDNLWLARSIAFKHCKAYPGADLDEAIAEAMLGLVMASQQYSPVEGTKFSSYAYRRINGQIHDGQRKHNGLVREANRKVDDEVGALVVSLFNKTTVGSIDAAHDEDSPIQAVFNLASKGPSVESVVVEQELLSAALRVLTEREAYVIVQYYLKQRTLIDIADDLGLTEGRVSQLKTKAVGDMRRALTPRK